jgi:hypothetical protein
MNSNPELFRFPFRRLHIAIAYHLPILFVCSWAWAALLLQEEVTL